jgi:hypothetical protein
MPVMPRLRLSSRTSQCRHAPLVLGLIAYQPQSEVGGMPDSPLPARDRPRGTRGGTGRGAGARSASLQ